MNQSSNYGVIFNIQKFSLHDGPGIRTVVFFKGCPLKCKWCANPESHSAKIQILWEKEKCINCKTCIVNCPEKAISNKKSDIYIDSDLCTGCHTCVNECPGHALKMEGEYKTVKQIMDICLQDKDFYEESGGGVTLSGGEALMHPEFALSVLKALKEQQIHTAIETTGFATPAIFNQVTDYADLLLFDIKHWDEKKHKEGTGVSNRLILENMQRAIADKKDVLPRLPVIPGYNNTLEDAAGFVRCLNEIGAKKVQLLPFHQFGEKKYDMLGKEYAYTDVSALHEDELEEFRQIFIENGVHAFF